MTQKHIELAIVIADTIKNYPKTLSLSLQQEALQKLLKKYFKGEQLDIKDNKDISTNNNLTISSSEKDTS